MVTGSKRFRNRLEIDCNHIDPGYHCSFSDIGSFTVVVTPHTELIGLIKSPNCSRSQIRAGLMRDQIRRTCLPSGCNAGIFELPTIYVDRQPHRLRAGDLFERSSTILFAEKRYSIAVVGCATVALNANGFCGSAV